MECNRETILDGLHDFEKRSNNISPILEEYLLKVAKTGDTMFPWIKLKPLLKRKLELVLTEFYETCPMDDLPPLPNVEIFKFDVLKTKLLDSLESFQSAPFTIQRMCELLTDPKKHYKRADKFMRGLEKNVLVVSTIEPKSSLQIDINSNSPPFMVNGLISVSPDHLQPSNLLRDNDSLDPEIGESLKINNCHTPLDNFASAFASAPSILTTTEVRELVSEKYVNAHCNEVANCNDECDVVTSVSTSHLATMDTSPDPSEINEDSAYSSDQRNSSPDDTSNYSVTDCAAEYVYQSSPEELPTSEMSTTQQESLGSPDVSEYATESCTLPIDSDEENYIHESSEIDNCDEETSEATEKVDETNYEISSSEVEESDVISNNSTSILVDSNILNHSSGGLSDHFVSSQLPQENSSSTLSLSSDIVKEVCSSELSEHNIVTGILSSEHKIATELAQNDHDIATELSPNEHDITTEISEQDVTTAIEVNQQGITTTSEHHIKTEIRPNEHDITTKIVHSNEYEVRSNVIETEVMDQDLN